MADLMALHAKLAPSDSERWLDCPAALSMDEHFPDTESFESREGTAAHELAAIEARYAFGKIGERELFDRRDAWRLANTEFDQKEISQHVDAYVVHLVSRFATARMVFIEHTVTTPIEDLWGTADAIAVFDDHVEVIDLKYGTGVEVKAWGNPQIRIYGLGVLDLCTSLVMTGLLEEVPANVVLMIYQPRRGNFTAEGMSSASLWDWFRAVVKPAVKRVYLPDPPFGPTARACRWCSAAGQCTAQKEKVLNEVFAPPGLMSPKDISDALQRVPEVKAWLATIEKVALDKAYRDGVEIPGWKVIRSTGSRVIIDSAAAIQTLIDAGFKAEQVAIFKAKGIGDLERVVGRNELPVILGDLLERRRGTESLVPVDDKRPAIDRNIDAAEAFK